jgi:hypothetical protein
MFGKPVEKYDALDQLVGVFHLLDRFLPPLLRQVLVTPVFEQPVMEPVLIDRGQFVPQCFIEKLDDFSVTLHKWLLSWAFISARRNASKKLCNVLPEVAAHSTCRRYWAGLERISRGVQRAGATDRATDFRAVQGFIDDLANGARASPALGAAPQTAIYVAGRPP